ncbi:MAG TPA: hypothetical protein VMX94_03650 [Armatimonadota bacterium]|nr:hypothetical protein [Armatimonadota bacterium]
MAEKLSHIYGGKLVDCSLSECMPQLVWCDIVARKNATEPSGGVGFATRREKYVAFALTGLLEDIEGCAREVDCAWPSRAQRGFMICQDTGATGEVNILPTKPARFPWPGARDQQECDNPSSRWSQACQQLRGLVWRQVSRLADWLRQSRRRDVEFDPSITFCPMEDTFGRVDVLTLGGWRLTVLLEMPGKFVQGVRRQFGQVSGSSQIIPRLDCVAVCGMLSKPLVDELDDDARAVLLAGVPIHFEEFGGLGFSCRFVHAEIVLPSPATQRHAAVLVTMDTREPAHV